MSTTSTPTTTPIRSLPRPSAFAEHWAHDPSIVFLNHGSFGGTPRAVMAAQTAYRERLEREPVDFFVNQHWGLMDDSRRALGGFVHARWDCIAPVYNATIGVATALHNLHLMPGDEVLTNTHEYPACQNNLRAIAAKAGAKVVVAEIPFPISSPGQALDAILSRVTDKTKAVLVSHVTSPTGLVLPVEPLVEELNRRGIASIVDGAHAPGMVAALNLQRMNPTCYTANLHKWVCSPKGSAFLYVRPELRDDVRPVILSNNAEKPRPGRAQFLTEFDYVGTSDYTMFYAVKDAIGLMSSLLPGGFAEVMRRNRELVLKGREVLCRAVGMEPPAPDSMIGSICTLVLPLFDAARMERLRQRPSRYHDALQDALLEKHRIQVPVWGLAGKPERFIRISAQLYNSVEQYEYLAAALKEELALEARI
ncbi:MAG TPA: aminotransferase class V-fold PLP-dependent enzyme [Phycisphaerales bacterium]|nr:aminotransferase class V-fold PLP-dependent enzyme [Phycisphaerales bacterium]